jgi:branched-chain amino acid transport system substrate-binding protein
MGAAPGLRAARRRLTLAALASVAAFAVAACGDDNGGGSEPAASPSKSRAASGTAAKSEPITDFLKYVDGKAGRADSSKSPITIGFVNAQGGQQSFPEPTRAAQATVRFINEELGGIDGRPVRLHTCFIANAEEEGQRCGQRMLNDDDVQVVLFGLVIIGNQSFFAQMDGAKPVVMGVANQPVDVASKNTYALLGSTTSVLAGYGTYVRDVLKAKTAAMVFPSQAGTIPVANATKKGLQDAGIEVKSVGYDAQATDLLGPITAAGSQTADALLPMTDVPGCINYAKSLEQSGIDKPVLAGPTCLSQQVAKGVGGDIPHWTFGIAQDIPSDTTNPAVKAYSDATAKHGLSKDDQSSVFASYTFSNVLALAKMLNEIGGDEISAETIAQQVKSFRGPLIMGPPEVQCGKDPKAPGVCNDLTQFFDYKGNGKFERASDWLQPPR